MSKAMYFLYGMLLSALYAKNESQFLKQQISAHISRPVWQQKLDAVCIRLTKKVIPT